jgi:predicted aldo/keto reductase-like oxidoreductase
MAYMVDRKDLSKTGMGTWGVGGFMKPNHSDDDERQISSLVYTLNKGVNYIETVYMYAQGKTVSLLSQAVKNSKIDREKIFITLSIYENDAKNINDVKEKIYACQTKYKKCQHKSAN